MCRWIWIKFSESTETIIILRQRVCPRGPRPLYCRVCLGRTTAHYPFGLAHIKAIIYTNCSFSSAGQDCWPLMLVNLSTLCFTCFSSCSWRWSSSWLTRSSCWVGLDVRSTVWSTYSSLFHSSRDTDSTFHQQLTDCWRSRNSRKTAKTESEQQP